MSNNINIKDANKNTKSIATEEVSSVHYSKYIPTDTSGNAYSSSNRFPVEDISESVIPSTYNGLTSAQRAQSINKGQLNKIRVRPMILNEYVESSRSVQATVTAAQMVGQVIRVSQENINSLFLTLGSLGGTTTIDNFESYANSPALQVEWVLTGTTQALLETVIVASGGSTKSMRLDANVLGDLWKNTIVPIDLTGGTVSFDFYLEDLNDSFTIGITEAANTMTATIAVTTKKNWQHFDIPIAAFSGAGDITAIDGVVFTVSANDKGKLAYVDNLTWSLPTGTLNLELYDLGATLPVSGVTKLSDGTQYTTLGDLGISGQQAADITLSLEGGKKLYHIPDFVAGAAPEMGSSNKLLTQDNYYALILKYVDTDVDVYGTDATLLNNYYDSGYSFTTPNAATAITAVMTSTVLRIKSITGTFVSGETITGGTSGATGTVTAVASDSLVYTVLAGTFIAEETITGGTSAATATSDTFNDSMFGIFSTQDVYLTGTTVKFDATPGNSAQLTLLNEDSNMNIEDVISVAEHHPGTSLDIDLSSYPSFMENGSKFECYYNDDSTDSITSATLKIRYKFLKPTING